MLTKCSSELIEPAQDKSSSTTLSSEMKDQLQNYIDPSNFLVSSIFCTFTAAGIANSFELRDQNGIKCDEGTAMSFMLKVSLYFTG